MIRTRAGYARISSVLLTAAVVCLCTTRTPAAPPIGAEAQSPYARLALADVVPPPVQITCPAPSADTALLCPPELQVVWSAPEQGRQSAGMPFQYKYILLGPSSEFPVGLAIDHPESFRDYYAHHPLGPWAGWDSTARQAPHALLTDLVPGEEYLFAVIALDRLGNYSPEFDLSANLLHVVPGYPRPDDPVSWNPVLTVSGPGFKYRYPRGGFCACDSAEIPTQMHGHQRSTLRWSADPGFVCESLHIRWYRWALDIEDVFDETPRINEETDLRHWSQRSLDATSARLGPFVPGEVHRLYIEASDDVGLLSLGIVRIEVVSPASRREVTLTAEPRRGGLTEVSYSLPESGNVEIGVYDLAGRRVATLENAVQRAGKHVVTWDASGFRQGVYFCRLRLGAMTATRPLLLLK